MGATWDPQVAELMGESTARAVKATGPQWDFAPVEDIARDTRWGRYYETFSEDPYLAGSLGAANIQGLQKTGQVAATVKHFAGYSAPFAGHDRYRAHLDMRYLQDTFLPAYKAAVDAGALTLMANSGVGQRDPGARLALPAHRRAAQAVGLQGRRGQRLERRPEPADRVPPRATTYAGAAAIAVNAGVDMAMLPPGSVDDYVSGADRRRQERQGGQVRASTRPSRGS